MWMSATSLRPVLALVALSGCMAAGRSIVSSTHGPPAPAAAGPPRPHAAIFSARLALVDDARLGGADGLLLVFSHEIDPLGLAPEGFSVVLADGRPVKPTQAHLGAANEADENRTAVLVGKFGDPTRNPPRHVTVVGSLHAEDGTVLRGLDRPVVGHAEPDLVVHAEPVPATADRCAGARQVIRTYWSDEIRGVTPTDLERIRIELADGRWVTPTAFDDHPPNDEGNDLDNVLDLCLEEGGSARSLRIDVGTFLDRAGHATADVNIRISPSAGPPQAPSAPAG